MGQIPEKTLLEKYGSLEAYKEMLHNKMSGKHFYTNGIEDKKFADGEEIPEGWYKGRTNCGKGTKGYFFINNGEEQTQIAENTPIPEGWIKGALKFTDEHKQKISSALKGKTKTEEHILHLKESHNTESYKEKIKNTCIKNLGVDNPFKSEKCRQKAKQTCLERYDDENYNNREKMKRTKQENWGDPNYNNREKCKQTCLDKYGYECIAQVPEIREKQKETFKRNHNGKEYFSQVPEIREKINKSYLEHYGTDHPLQTKEVLDKQIKTNLQKRGVEYNIQLLQAKNGYSNDSKPNKEFAELLSNNNIEFEREFPLSNRSFDFKIKNSNILIEINPTATHNTIWSPFGNHKVKNNCEDYHYEKSKLAEKNNYRCIHIFDWDNKEKIINLLKPRETIYARKCIIKEIGKKECNDFIEKNHLQGKCNGNNIRIGLFYKDELVSLMTFGKPRYNKKYDYELLRACCSKNIVGGFQKIFKYFLENYGKTKKIISYCDFAKFEGKIYKDLGFRLIKETPPNKHWFSLKTGRHITNNLLLQLGFDKLFNTNYGKGTSNEDLIIKEGYVSVYDCGQKVFVYE